MLRDVRNPRHRDYLATIRASHQELTADAFRALFEYDTTWGLFGQRMQHFNEQLCVVAMTHFVPHAPDTASDADDVLLLLTPIYRVLCTLTALTLKESGYEAFATKDLVLPQRPRAGVDMGRYTSLLDVACSVWLEVCHAYVKEEADDAQGGCIVKELYCFNADQSRARLLWLDVLLAKDEVHIRQASNPLPVAAAYNGVPVLLVRPDEQPPPAPANANTGSLLCLQQHPHFPWVELVWARCDALFFLLVTRENGHFVSFHRVVGGRTTVYPLWMHLLDDASSERVKSACAVCGKSDVPLSASVMTDPEPGNLYCGQRCMTQMEGIRAAKLRADEERKRAEALRLRLPPGK